MRDYQPKSERWIEHNTYMRILYTIRSYPELLAQRIDIIEESNAGQMDGQPRGTNIGDSTASKASKIERYSNDIIAIEKGIKMIPKEYREAVWDNVITRKPYPDTANIKTWTKYKCLFIRSVGHNLGLL